jgi:hypothetical protein
MVAGSKMAAMKWLDSMSARRTAEWSFAGGAMVMVAIVAASLMHNHVGVWFWVAVGTGYVVMGIMELRLAKGVRSGRWSDAELDGARRLLGRGSFWQWVNLAYFLCYAVALFVVPMGKSLFPVGLLAMLSPLRMTGVLKPKDSEPAHTDWRGALPIRSEHWGQAGMDAAGHGE